MAKAIVPCQSCGALGELDTVCPFCGTTIQRTIESDESFNRIINRSTVSAQVFAERVAKYQHVESFKKPGLAVVRIGDLHGIINRNGNILVPMQYANIEVISDREVGYWAFLDDGENVKLLNLSSGHLINWSDESPSMSYNGSFVGFSIEPGLKSQIIIIERYEKRDKKVTYNSAGEWYKDIVIKNNFSEVFDLEKNKGVFSSWGNISEHLGLLYEVEKKEYIHKDVEIGYASMRLITDTKRMQSIFTSSGEEFADFCLVYDDSSEIRDEEVDEDWPAGNLYLSYYGDIEGLGNWDIDKVSYISDINELGPKKRLRVSDNFFKFDPKRDSKEQTADLIDFIRSEKEKLLQKINSCIKQEGTDVSNMPTDSGSLKSIDPLTLIVIGVFLIIGILFFLLGSW